LEVENGPIYIQKVKMGLIPETLNVLVLSTNHQDKNWKDHKNGLKDNLLIVKIISILIC